MGDRKLTIYNGREAFKKSPPQIFLQGNWLEKAGFSAGDKITVKCQHHSKINFLYNLFLLGNDCGIMESSTSQN